MSDTTLPAGPFGAWLDRTLEGGTAEVPCGTCTACCRSAYFVHVRPDETATLARIPPHLRFPAPGLPAGHVVLPYDDEGRCPMLVDDRCSIYEDRPRTCRTYDCRVFAATGLDPADDGKPAIAAQARRWRFDPDADDAERADAVRRAAAFLAAHPEVFDTGPDPAPPRPDRTQLAVLALRAHTAFLPRGTTPDVATVRQALSEVV